MVGKINTVQTAIKFVTIDDNRYAVKHIHVHENTHIPVLVFLHEGLGCIELWRDFPEKICNATGLNGIVYDRLGHGKSDPLPQHRTPAYLHDEALIYLPPFLEKTGVDNPFFIGHSDGGTIALLYAAQHPGRTAGFITEAAHVFLEDITVRGIQKAVEAYESGKLKKGLIKYHGDKTDALFYGWAYTWLSPEFRHWNIVDELKSIYAPSLIIQGNDDEYGTEKQVDAIVNTVQGETEKCIIPECGHVPHHQAGDAVTERMVEFIKTVINGI